MSGNKAPTIKSMAAILDVTPESIRHYERLGIIRSERDEESNYRLYDENQHKIVMALNMYRSMGFSLEECRTLLTHETPHALVEDLHRRCEDIACQQQELQQRLERCRYLIDELEGCGEWGCRQADSPALLRLRCRESPAPLAWTNAMPYVSPCPIITVEELTDPKGQMWDDSLCVYAQKGAELGLIDTPGVELLPERPCVTALATGEGMAPLNGHTLAFMTAYIKEKGLQIAGEAFARKLYTLNGENGRRSSAYRVWIPVNE